MADQANERLQALLDRQGVTRAELNDCQQHRRETAMTPDQAIQGLSDHLTLSHHIGPDTLGLLAGGSDGAGRLERLHNVCHRSRDAVGRDYRDRGLTRLMEAVR